jgi:limonene-1,2-epoxide hydrolase
MTNDASSVVQRLFAAIESRDLRAVRDVLAVNATWQNVPSDAAVGRDAVLALLAPILTWSDEVRWDVRTSSCSGSTSWVERIDRFWIAGVEHAVRCAGVFDVDLARGEVVSVRDYVDLQEWRERIGPVYQRLEQRDAIAVVQRHLDAVARRDPVAMAADYHLTATLTRDSTPLDGWMEIADYFDGVPERLSGSTFAVETLSETRPGHVVSEWSITQPDGAIIRGSDQFTVEAGRISAQQVQLDSNDF